jgi:hypothetical protein
MVVILIRQQRQVRNRSSPVTNVSAEAPDFDMSGSERFMEGWIMACDAGEKLRLNHAIVA